jgi:Zn-dependent peptidase ImmA (M78 family)
VLCRRRKVILIASGSTWPEKRCSLAHAVAHLDLGHHEVAGRQFAAAHERAANQLAARRMVTLDALADVLSWTRSRGEIASELDVDVPTLQCRMANLYGGEQMWLRSNVRWLEETA